MVGRKKRVCQKDVNQLSFESLIRKMKMRDKEAKEKIMSSLVNSQYKWRTSQGISKDTGIPLQQVEKILNASDFVIRARKGNKQGHPLYSTKEKYEKQFGFAQRLLSVITNKVGG